MAKATAKEPMILAIDQGTTSTRVIAFDSGGRPRHSAQQEFPQHYPRSGWVEHDPDDIWSGTLSLLREVDAAVQAAGGHSIAIGIANQRETTLVWDRESGQAVHNAIVWQDRRTADMCVRLVAAGYEDMIQERTGLVIDPYFSASKIAWLLENVTGARDAAENGRLAFGTVDSFLLWRLTGGRHATDVTNAARTMLFDIHKKAWDDDLLTLFDIPSSLMPEVLPNAAPFGGTQPDLMGRSIPVLGMAGDQQAAVVGQACFAPGMIKSTYGTGCFALLNTGANAVASKHRLITTIAYEAAGQTAYALEGSIFVAGAAVQWLRDSLALIATAAETEGLAAGLEGNRGVYLVPAFTGLGAPYWDAAARGALYGLTRNTGRAEIVRATLESVAYQTADLLKAMAADTGAYPTEIRVDGGMVANGWLMQFLADLLGLTVDRPGVAETTALGAAYLAGLEAELYDSLDALADLRGAGRLFQPETTGAERDALYEGWRDAVARTRSDGRGAIPGSV